MSAQRTSVGDVVMVPDGYGAHSGRLGRVLSITGDAVSVEVIMVAEPRVADVVAVRPGDMDGEA